MGAVMALRTSRVDFSSIMLKIWLAEALAFPTEGMFDKLTPAPITAVKRTQIHK